MIDLSRGSLALPSGLALGVPPLGDVTPLMWPTYRRVTTAKGGDATAAWSFSAPEVYLDQWLEEGLGQEFTEFYGIPVFSGLVYEITTHYPGSSYRISLDSVANKIATYYTSIVTEDTLLTSFFTDDNSIARWGTRYLFLRPSAIMSQAEAEDLAQAILAQSANPRIERGPIQSSGTTARAGYGRAAVKVQGYSGGLDNDRYYEPSTGTEGVSTQIASLISGAELVAAGDIRANSTAATIQSDYKGILARLHELGQYQDGSGNRYLYGCFGSNLFDYIPVDQSIRYRVFSQRQPVLYQEAGQEVPHPLVKPGGYSLVADAGHGRPAEGMEDYRVQWDFRVEYSRAGASIAGEGWDLAQRTQILAQRILGSRGDLY